MGPVTACANWPNVALFALSVAAVVGIVWAVAWHYRP